MITPITITRPFGNHLSLKHQSHNSNLNPFFYPCYTPVKNMPTSFYPHTANYSYIPPTNYSGTTCSSSETNFPIRRHACIYQPCSIQTTSVDFHHSRTISSFQMSEYFKGYDIQLDDLERKFKHDIPTSPTLNYPILMGYSAQGCKNYDKNHSNASLNAINYLPSYASGTQYSFQQEYLGQSTTNLSTYDSIPKYQYCEAPPIGTQHLSQGFHKSYDYGPECYISSKLPSTDADIMQEQKIIPSVKVCQNQPSLSNKHAIISNYWGLLEEQKTHRRLDPENVYIKLMEQLQIKNEKFKDLNFPPSQSSLIGSLNGNKLVIQYIDFGFDWQSLIWLRPAEFFGTSDYKIIKKDIKPNDIKQGYLGACYFLSTLAALADHPEIIERLLVNKEINDYGCYSVRICNMGEWEEIILDDYFPCFPDDKSLVFSRSLEKELWVLLLEKAWAKLSGSFSNIDTGSTRESLHDFTGAPIKIFMTLGISEEEKEIIWEEIKDGHQKKFIMTCGAAYFYGNLDQLTQVGLVASHAYSILAAQEIDTDKGRMRLVKLRNPWGEAEWTGDWGHSSALWTTERKKQLKYQNKCESIFYMSYDDILKYFSDIEICQYHDYYIYSSIKTNCNYKNASFFKVKINQEGQYYFTINQKLTRSYSDTNNLKYSTVWMVLGKCEEDDLIYVDSAFKADREVWTSNQLTPGTYILYSKISWLDQRTHDFVVSGYGPSEVKFQQMTKAQLPYSIERVYIDRGRHSRKLEGYIDLQQPQCLRAVELTEEGYGFIYYQNNGTKVLNEQVKFKILEGLKLCKPYRGTQFQIRVAPGEEKIVLFKINPDVDIIRQSFIEISEFN